MPRRVAGTALSALLLTPGFAAAQIFESAGTRAAGMAGAFVGVADDASAVYWNPAGLGLGAYFSLLIDSGTTKAEPNDDPNGGTGAGSLIALGTPPLGLAYYRLRSSTLAPDGRQVRLQTLTTHHAGVTFVQSLADRIAVGTTLRLVRGVAAVAVVPPGDRAELLDDVEHLDGQAGTDFDADIGIMAVFGALRAGLTVRNVGEATFDAAGTDDEIRMKRQTRAGIAYLPVAGVLLAADIDLERAQGSLGEVRNMAVGTELQLLRRAFFRSGFRLNTLSDEPGAHAPVWALGGSYAVFGRMLVDVQITRGSDAGDRGWGLAGRVVF